MPFKGQSDVQSDRGGGSNASQGWLSIALNKQTILHFKKKIYIWISAQAIVNPNNKKRTRK